MTTNNEIIANIIDIVKKLNRAEVTHLELSSALKKYKNINKKIHDLIKNKTLLKLQKGFYRVNSSFITTESSDEILAQMLYGPSYLSMEWALSEYGCIPEQVFTLTSITLKRQKKIKIQNISFQYKHLGKNKYSLGLQSIKKNNNSILFASPLKALIDLMYFSHKNISTETDQQISDYLNNDLRLDIKNFMRQIGRTEISSALIVYKRVAYIKNILNYLHRRAK